MIAYENSGFSSGPHVAQARGNPSEGFPMFRSVLVFTCALTAAACGGTDNKTAQDPSMTTVTSGSTDPNLAAQSTNASPTDSTSSSTMPSTSGSNGDTTGSANNMNNTPTASQTMPPASGNPGSANGTTNADNTKINDRDRHGALTPLDQGNSKAETDITAAIRKAVVGTKGLSFNAKNVKIITTGTKVTLRGPVNSDQEKSTIENLARQAAGVTSVDDQLEIKK